MEGVKEADYSMSVGPEQLMNSLWTNDSSTIYEIMTSGKSGALFYFTKDRKYMLKSIAHREFNKLFTILSVYLKHLEINKDTLMTKFFGMYKLAWKNPANTTMGVPKKVTHYIIVMTNLFKHFDVGMKFDLKGSTKSRTQLKEGETLTKREDITVALKCNDFRTQMKAIHFVE